MISSKPNKKLAIMGASGHGKVLADLAELNGWQNIVFYDDSKPKGSHIEHWKVVGNYSELLKDLNTVDGVILGIGNNDTRLSLHKHLREKSAPLVSLVHPSAVVSPYSELGLGCVVMANAVISSFVKIEDACIINTASSIDHECYLADGVHISPGVNVAGGVIVGKRSWLGIGCSVKQQVLIGKDVTVGAGAAVVNDIPDEQTVVGVPARP